MIALSEGHYGVRNSYTEIVDNWVEAHRSVYYGGLVPVAISVIERVLTPPSELLDLWDQGDATEWKNMVEDLRNRVET